MIPPIGLLTLESPRYDHARVFEAIRQARPPRLYIAADGPRLAHSGEAEMCAEARRIATSVDWSCEVRTLFRDRYLGCREAVSGGTGTGALFGRIDNERMMSFAYSAADVFVMPTRAENSHKSCSKRWPVARQSLPLMLGASRTWSGRVQPACPARRRARSARGDRHCADRRRPPSTPLRSMSTSYRNRVRARCRGVPIHRSL
jgi:hypothetical protein